jgi:hypothetical protein
MIQCQWRNAKHSSSSMKVIGANAGSQQAVCYCAASGNADNGAAWYAANAADDTAAAERRFAGDNFWCLCCQERGAKFFAVAALLL